ncbi:hypothetical protein N0V86_005925 [Didymella sp. IMI 355093]|nr:hypothetical protein N0V86_005925 [Didymella sp. IMI 355093]
MATLEAVKAQRFRTAVRGGVVTVEVGPERVKHFIHKALLEEKSEYFKKALNGPWKEAEDKVVFLDDVDCRSFAVFVDWLYTGEIPADCDGFNDDRCPKVSGNKLRALWHTNTQLAMLKAYTFADRMISPDLCKALEHHIIDYFIYCESSYYGAVIYAFTRLPPTNPILRVMIDSHCHSFLAIDDEEHNGELQLRAQLPNAFLVGVMLRLAKVNSELLAKVDECDSCDYAVDLDAHDYHDHATEKERKECQKAAFV